MVSVALHFFLVMALLSQPASPTRLLQETISNNSTSIGSGGGGNSSSLIPKACNHTRYYDLCVSSLKSHPGSQRADLAGLASISLDLGIAYARETAAYARALARTLRASANDTFGADCLADCLAQYGDALDDLGQSKGALRRGEYDTVNAMVSGAMTDSDTCEEGFRDKPGYASPLTDRNERFQMLCSNSLAITNLLLT